MQRAIRIDDGLSIIPVFYQEEGVQLTKDGGFQGVSVTTCILYNARGLDILGVGQAIQQPEDDRDDRVGTKLALGRALKNADGMFSKDERNHVFQVFRNELEMLELRERLREF